MTKTSNNSVLWWILQLRSGFDTTYSSDGDNSESLVNESFLKELCQASKEVSKINVSATVYNSFKGCNEVIKQFTFTIFNTDTLVIDLPLSSTVSSIGKEIILNIFYFVKAGEIKKVMFLVNRACKDYGKFYSILVKILQGLMTFGFKLDNSANNRFVKTGNSKVFTIEIGENFYSLDEDL